MEDALRTILISLATAAGGVLITIVIQALVTRWKNTNMKKQEALQHVSTEEQEKRIEEIIISNLIPISKTVESISTRLGNLEEVSVKNNASSSRALQSILRDRLYQLARQGIEKGYSTDEEKINFENMYTEYHSLGANGVMDKKREDFLALPSEPLKRKSSEKKRLLLEKD